jgi:hypothetical protein
LHLDLGAQDVEPTALISPQKEENPMRLSALLLAAALVAPFAPASAGTRHQLPVIVDPANGFAQGSFSTASEANTLQFLRCEFSGDGFALFCDARDQTGKTGHCKLHPDSPLYPGFARNARALSSASFIALYWNPATRICTEMRLVNGSDLLPDYPNPASIGLGVTVGATANPSTAAAALTNARYSSNQNEFLSCEIWAASGAIRCYARDPFGTTVTCATTEQANPGFAANVRAIDHSSFVAFLFDPALGSCLDLIIQKRSDVLP